ncbi:PREDICTED: glyceraldehyde-3-phosphate dehydrogenase-like [Diuraphis noxia]|uniref:glyceraldehyde-3-phosphate dehydrogenase-like n=1 Tax=Diuraphis noxia TaxID=143948 RepID=UPI0007639733|nr:PREDICTED: glyceraldehyde-3-phosphate dehydrogenase-like [Diuraphis noxia]
MIINGLPRLVFAGLSSVQTMLCNRNSSSVTRSKFSWKDKSVRSSANHTNFLRQLSVGNIIDFCANSSSVANNDEQITNTTSFAINGFGRIGKCVLRLAIQNDMNVVAINEPSVNISAIANSFKYDTVHGMFPGVVDIKGDSLDINGKIIRVYTEKNPEKIKWKELPVNYVIDSTGSFTEVSKAKKHIEAGVKKVIISAPSKDAPMLVKGVNFDQYRKTMSVVSNASCTTNCAAPLIHIINNTFGVEYCLLTTVHAMTSSQNVLDTVKQRSASGNIVHSTTGAAKAVGIVIPELKGKVTGDSVRVPTLDVSLLKLYLIVKNPVKLVAIKCAIWKDATQNNDTVISYIDDTEKLVSTDFVGSQCSAIVDFSQVSVIGDKFVTIGAWYDNEMGYSSRLLDLYTHMVKMDSDNI